MLKLKLDENKNKTKTETQLVEKNLEVLKVDCVTEEVDMAIADDDQTLSTWMVSSRLSSGKNINGLKKARGRQIGIPIEEASANDVKTGSGKGGSPLENQALPFVKKSPIWKTIESLEVFQILPQTPHFRPLVDTKDLYREGLAIGLMVTFAVSFEKISKLQFDDSRSIFHSILEGLVGLERHGFDIMVLRNRVNELLSIKDLHGPVLDAEMEISEHTREKIRLDEEMEGIRTKINELQEKLESTKSKMEAMDVEITRFQSHADALNVRGQSVRHDFEKLAAAPWKLS